VVPILETARLTLRGHQPDDLEASAAMWGDAQVTRHIGGRPPGVCTRLKGAILRTGTGRSSRFARRGLAREEAWTKLLRYAGHWTWLGFGYWVVTETASGRFVGEVGFADFRRDIEPPLGEAPEIGWVLVPSVHGRGYATEAVRAALAWGDAHFGPRRTVCLIAPGNAASLRVADKCGYREVARTTYHGDATILLERAPPG
jgi:RimJ/RimL family protein N-acetyltransferase